jgi:hypothetical protein
MWLVVAGPLCSLMLILSLSTHSFQSLVIKYPEFTFLYFGVKEIILSISIFYENFLKGIMGVSLLHLALALISTLIILRDGFLFMIWDSSRVTKQSVTKLIGL